MYGVIHETGSPEHRQQSTRRSTYRQMLHEVEQNVDVVVGPLRRIFLEELAHSIAHDQRLNTANRRQNSHTLIRYEYILRVSTRLWRLLDYGHHSHDHGIFGCITRPLMHSAIALYFPKRIITSCARGRQNMPRPLQVDLLILKVVSESCVTWATSVLSLVFLGLPVLDLGPMYATGRRQTDRRQTRIIA